MLVSALWASYTELEKWGGGSPSQLTQVANSSRRNEIDETSDGD